MSGFVGLGFPNGPIVDPGTGFLTQVGQAFLSGLFQRTGGPAGGGGPALAAEASTRAAADAAEITAREAAVSAEATARAAAVSGEATTRASADAALQTQITAIDPILSALMVA